METIGDDGKKTWDKIKITADRSGFHLSWNGKNIPRGGKVDILDVETRFDTHHIVIDMSKKFGVQVDLSHWRNGEAYLAKGMNMMTSLKKGYWPNQPICGMCGDFDTNPSNDRPPALRSWPGECGQIPCNAATKADPRANFFCDRPIVGKPDVPSSDPCDLDPAKLAKAKSQCAGTGEFEADCIADYCVGDVPPTITNPKEMVTKKEVVEKKTLSESQQKVDQKESQTKENESKEKYTKQESSAKEKGNKEKAEKEQASKEQATKEQEKKAKAQEQKEKESRNKEEANKKEKATKEQAAKEKDQKEKGEEEVAAKE